MTCQFLGKIKCGGKCAPQWDAAKAKSASWGYAHAQWGKILSKDLLAGIIQGTAKDVSIVSIPFVNGFVGGFAGVMTNPKSGQKTLDTPCPLQGSECLWDQVSSIAEGYIDLKQSEGVRAEMLAKITAARAELHQAFEDFSTKCPACGGLATSVAQVVKKYETPTADAVAAMPTLLCECAHDITAHWGDTRAIYTSAKLNVLKEAVSRISQQLSGSGVAYFGNGAGSAFSEEQGVYTSHAMGMYGSVAIIIDVIKYILSNGVGNKAAYHTIIADARFYNLAVAGAIPNVNRATVTQCTPIYANSSTVHRARSLGAQLTPCPHCARHTARTPHPHR